MPRIDSSSSTPVPIDTTPEAVPAPAPSRTKDAQAPASAARNEVRAWDGPPRRPPQAPASGTAPATSGPAMSAGELAVLGGRPRQASSSEVPGNVYEAVRSHLTRSLQDWAVSDCDVKAVHTVLGTLQPGPYRAALERMERDGLLGTYVKEQTPEARQAFLEQAESKGMLHRRKGDAPAGPLGYPAVPDFFRNDARLPESMRDAVNQHAIQVGADFYRAHSAYLDRYIEAAGAAKNLEELKALGEPREAYLDAKLLDIDRRDPARKGYESAWREGIGQPVSRNRAYQAVRARELELSGERPTGIQAHAKGDITRMGFKVSRELQLDTRGRVDLKDEAGLSVKGGPVGVEVMLDSAGKMKLETKLDAGFAELSESSDGTRKLEIKVGKLAGAFVELNLPKAEFGGGVSAELEAGGFKFGGEAGVNMKGLTSERLKESFDKNHRGIFDASSGPAPKAK